MLSSKIRYCGCSVSTVRTGEQRVCLPRSVEQRVCPPRSVEQRVSTVRTMVLSARDALWF